VPNEYIADKAHEDLAELIGETIEETLANIENLSDELIEGGWLNLRIEQDWIQDHTYIYPIFGDRPMTEAEKEKAKKARAKKRAEAKQRREAKREAELKELERLQRKYG
jgi:hypothetical protein